MATNPLFSFRPSTEQIEAAITVFKCMAMVDVIRPVVEGYKQKILNELGYAGLTPKTSYQLPESVWPEYQCRCNEERIAAKLHVDDPGHCPLLVAENLLTQAQRLLTDVMEPVSGISFDRIFRASNALKNYESLIDLNLRLLAPWCKGRM